MIVAVTEDLVLKSLVQAAAPRDSIRVARDLAEAGRLVLSASLLLVDLEYSAASVGVLLSAVRRMAERPRVVGWVTQARWEETVPLHRLCDSVYVRKDFVERIAEILGPGAAAG